MSRRLSASAMRGSGAVGKGQGETRIMPPITNSAERMADGLCLRVSYEKMPGIASSIWALHSLPNNVISSIHCKIMILVHTINSKHVIRASV